MRRSSSLCQIFPSFPSQNFFFDFLSGPTNFAFFIFRFDKFSSIIKTNEQIMEMNEFASQDFRFTLNLKPGAVKFFYDNGKVHVAKFNCFPILFASRVSWKLFPIQNLIRTCETKSFNAYFYICFAKQFRRKKVFYRFRLFWRITVSIRDKKRQRSLWKVGRFKSFVFASFRFQYIVIFFKFETKIRTIFAILCIKLWIQNVCEVHMHSMNAIK